MFDLTTSVLDMGTYLPISAMCVICAEKNKNTFQWMHNMNQFKEMCTIKYLHTFQNRFGEENNK